MSTAAGLGANRQGSDKVIGQAWGDFDNDGRPDFYATDHAGPNTLYHNEGDGTFTVSPLNKVVALADDYSAGAVFVDFDNDGWRDLYVVNWGANVLFRNVNGVAFEDVTAAAGVGDGGNGKTAAWGDYDQDGFVDLYVANWACYPKCGRPDTGDIDRLYHNNGDGTFSNVTNLLGGKIAGSGFVASWTDYDNDGDLDIYLVNDEFINPVGNGLWRNDGPGCDGWCFSDVSKEAGADTKLMGMGLATGDYDNDGDQDFFFSNAGPMMLLQNQGDGAFVNVAEAAGVDSANSTGWGAVFVDYDNDGWQDLYLAVSDVAGGEEGAASSNDDAPSPLNQLYHNNQDGSFTNVSEISGASASGATLGVATADYDRDGRVDLLVGNIDTGYLLYRNQSAAALANHWFTLELVGDGPVNRDAIGSRVYVTTADGLTLMQEVICGGSLGAGNDLALHFGLGRHADITQLEIYWPDGKHQSFTDIRADRFVMLTYPVDVVAEDAQQAALYADAPVELTGELPPLQRILLILLLWFVGL
ncbi:MAG: CRTAC1 family protein [Caldilineaceae bacterium]